MRLKKTRMQILHEPKMLGDQAKTGVSLHCHTLHSKEMLDFIPYYAERIPILSFFWRRECRKYIENGKKIPDFAKGYWLPPLTGEDVFESEKENLNKAGLEAIVSITDHDCIEANLEINRKFSNSQAPISLEWTVPFEAAYFHVGVHNLPPENAIEIKDLLLNFTFTPEIQNAENLNEILAMLNELPNVLLVLNHPVWDIEMIGQERHETALKNFLRKHGDRIHALEINGFRPWSENKAVIEISETFGFPLISGGDRHCLHHNTAINLTNAQDFNGFVEEIRTDKQSQIVLMPEYKKPLAFRQICSISQIMRNYPEFPKERQCWQNRVFIDFDDEAGLRPLSFHWENESPKWLDWLMKSVQILSRQHSYFFFRLIMKRKDLVPKTLDSTQHSSKIGEKSFVPDF